MVMALQYGAVDWKLKRVEEVRKIIDRHLDDVGDRMMVKHFCENLDYSDIAYHAGLSREALIQRLFSAGRRLEQRRALHLLIFARTIWAGVTVYRFLARP